jgi:hypothetical protein
MDLTPDQPPKTTKRGGRPPFKITPEAQAQVASLAKLGIPHDQIAFKLRISANTLRKHFRAELYDAAIEANTQVLQKLLDLALHGHPTAATFWARTRCKFRNGGSPLDEETSQSKPSGENASNELEAHNNDGEPLAGW